MPKKILLADDSITIQKVVELTFSDGDYEVTAVNNGAKAIQKLSEMRPDIILSDIIMPEKNGYEVCEFVKSHPEYRNIPVILLTGTFEPFDPDRADKAGCDAVVTKPFESQSLIHKVEELIQQSQATMATSEPEETAPALFADTPSFESPAEPIGDPFAHDNDIFAAAPTVTSGLASDMPFDSPVEAELGGETRSFSRMSFEEMQQTANEPATPATAPQPAMPDASPWDEAPAAFGGETRAFTRMSFEEMQQMANAPAAAPPPPPVVEASPWAEQQDDASTRAIPKMSFEEMRQMAESTPPFEAPVAAPEPEASPWDEQPEAFSGETRAFTRMSFEQLEQMASTPAEALPTADPFAESIDEPAWAPSAPAVEEDSEPLVNNQITDHVNDQITDVNSQTTDVNPQITDVNPQITDVNSQVTDVNPQITDLTDEQVDRIARRVVQLMSEQVVRNIAWEVIPDLAEMVVKERIRQLEAEA